MDLNKSLQLSSTPTRPLQIHEFMPMPAPTLHGNHQVIIETILCLE